MITLNFDGVIFYGATSTALGFKLLGQGVESFGLVLKAANHGYGFSLAALATGLYSQILLIRRQIGYPSGKGIRFAEFAIHGAIARV